MVIVVLLAVGVFCYFLWRQGAMKLTRNCRWRQVKSQGHWRCNYCGAVEPGDAAPRICRNPRRLG
ncbi:hypothetical protein N6L27_10280 [Leisingera sp. SS27]|uniref:hypothetical protein n=1 Tax=Leisingera sp. SS27 TaxID=2979462 RepID=UPI00232EF236|nr:hypothetical protein [Leisingera sp. SS27]MDC0658383.1 hypothetical protein [Leisingera sp. SS27]